MKKISVIVVSILSCLLVGCSSSDKKASLNSTDVNQKVVESENSSDKSINDEKLETKQEEKKEDITAKKELIKKSDTNVKSNIKNDNAIRKLHKEKKESNKQSVNFKEEFYGKWIIKNIATYGPVNCYSEKDKKEVLGKEIFYSKDLFKYNNKVFKNIDYSKKTLNEDEFHLMYKIPIKKLGINDSKITIITVYKDKEHIQLWDDYDISEIVVMDHNTIILSSGGVYFKAVRKK
ncbi:hypothetical protein Z959_13125 [Clostridium novyi B str. ATCC 27606]|uniref:Lipoprotein n=3 Tax=Clostridium TaxID=1485 RepID=C4IXG4_CLOBO|nr:MULTISPECIES: hypothetical protein [Clostridium]ACT33668.1 putative lipoprotein [Clostridium botulinum D str. 1873]KEI11808.1 hypothetical protein Z959_13125 [Clostridium novyi B str. ATCC 27606]MBO3442472.1 hypothetical protein [Clostridium haemolyticum]NFV48116.1 hypothetical protein [Clostridium botulinum]QPW56665.1 hypothetical protein IRP61_11760 [Clostridium botulinum]